MVWLTVFHRTLCARTDGKRLWLEAKEHLFEGFFCKYEHILIAGLVKAKLSCLRNTFFEW